MVATGKSPRLGLSTEFTRWKQRLDPKNAASTGMKPVESHGPSLRLVATNYRPTGIKPVVAKRRKDASLRCHVGFWVGHAKLALRDLAKHVRKIAMN